MPQPVDFPLKKDASQIFALAIQDIIGEEETSRIFNIPASIRSKTSFETLTFRHLSEFLSPLEQHYNERVRCGLLYRVGKTFFEDLLRRREKQMGFLDLDFRTLPTPKRIHAGMGILASTITEIIGIPIGLGEDEESWFWFTEEIPPKVQTRGEWLPLCFFMAGLLKAYIGWVTGEKNYPLGEKPYTSTTPLSCTIQIGKHPSV